MTLECRTRLEEYEILEPIGAGGMGEVYRARDTKLGREVAVKLLPDPVASPERVERFEREARLLAALSHPNIAVLHGLHRTGERHFLVMELVSGETLAERISRGPMPLEEALPIFCQIASGVAAAHAKGIVHRDLKPANIKLGPGGAPKVLDFGLAKAFGASLPASTESASPTITRDTSETGLLLGTAAYMSPEQAQGKPIDKRTDVWAFGCCFFEAVTGRPLFASGSVAATLANVLKLDPDFDSLPSDTPPRVRRVLRRCLERNPDRRLRDLEDARVELEAEDEEIVDRARTSHALAVGALAAAALVGSLLVLLRARVDGASSDEAVSPRLSVEPSIPRHAR